MKTGTSGTLGNHIRRSMDVFVFLLVMIVGFYCCPGSIPVCCGEEIPRIIPCEWSGVPRIIAVGDVHGDFEQFRDLLRRGEVIDGENHWIAGKTHLVQTGDVLDRGPDSKKVMDLLMSLEQAALEAGGRVHALLGNHEVMVMRGDYRYVTGYEFIAHGGEEAFRQAMSVGGRYGDWFLTHNAVIKINDCLFAHGGISPSYAAFSLRELNEEIRNELRGSVTPRIILDDDNPLWYRGLALDDEGTGDFQALIKRVLHNFGVRHIIIGHTVSKDGIGVKSNGAIIMIDVGMSRYYGGTPALLEITGDRFSIIAMDRTEKQSLIMENRPVTPQLAPALSPKE